MTKAGEKCVVCGANDSGWYGKDRIQVCFDCYVNGKFKKWLVDNHIEDVKQEEDQ